MGQNLCRIEAAYDAVAEEYAETFSSEHEKKPKDREMLLRFSREVGDRRPIWDLGCGPGHTTRFLKDLGIDVSGLDLSEKLLEQARRRHPGIIFRKGNLLGLDLDDGSTAGITSFYAMVHFTKEQVEKAFSEIFRVLQPGGQLLFTYHIGQETIRLHEFLGRPIDIDFMFYTTGFISGCLKKSGFEKIDIIEREPYPGVEYQSRRAYAFARKPDS